MTSIRYCYSRDEETYNGDCESFDEAVAEVTAEIQGEAPGTYPAWIGEVLAPREMLPDWWIGGRIYDDISESLYDEVGEYAENFEMTVEQQRALGKIVFDWLDANVGFHCYGVKNPVRVDVESLPDAPNEATP